LSNKKPLLLKEEIRESRGLDEKNNMIIDLFVSEVKGDLGKYDTPQDEFAV